MDISRRYFLKTSGALAVYCGVCPIDLLSGASVSPTPVAKGKTLVVIFLRGGADGLNLVVPYADPNYYKLRKGIGIPAPGQENGAHDLDGFFGLNPRAAKLAPLFSSGQAVALHAVGYASNTRSHFEEQDVWETGVTGNTIHSDGWLNRHLLTSSGHGPIRAIHIGDMLPRILHGKAPAYAVRGISDLTLPEGKIDQTKIAAALEHAYCCDPRQHYSSAKELLFQTGVTTLDGVEQLREITKQPYQPKVEYPKSGLSNKLKEVARLIKANIGVEVAEVDLDGWDTHNNQGGVNGGYGNNVQQLSDAIAAFSADLDSKMDDVLILTLSDFGRTAAENGTAGTDHGWANFMFAIGGPVLATSNGKPRPVLTKWPGLAPEQLYQKRDLLHTTDFRDVLAEAVSQHLKNPNLQTILPQHQFQRVGFIG